MFEKEESEQLDLFATLFEKAKLAALALCLGALTGCASLVSEPIYNVAYSYDIERHEYLVMFKEDPLGEEQKRTVPLDYVKCITVREYPKRHYSSDEWVTVYNEYFKAGNSLYIYALV